VQLIYNYLCHNCIAVAKATRCRETTLTYQAAEHAAPTEEHTPKEEQAYYCCLCYEKFPRDKLISPCKTAQHDLWCGDCIGRAFQVASTEIGSMPAKCHNIIQLHHAMPFISAEVAAAYQDQFDLWSTKDRVYCPVPSCSAFIAPRLIDAAMDEDSATVGKLECPQCHISLCTDCRDLSHPNEPCCFEDVDPEVMKALTKWGYKRCPKCKEAVRRMYGCKHMRCICELLLLED
jgi:hypothetical protein